MSQHRNEPAATLHPLLETRWSPRAFSTESLTDAELLPLFEAARWAPSASNEQPWRFIVARRDQAEAFGRIFACLSESNRRWAGTAGALAIAVAARFTGSGRENSHARYDLGQAVAHLTVQAADAGIYVHQMGGFSADAARAAFAIPEGFDPAVAIALGRLGDVEALDERDRERESKTRDRRSLSKTVFGGAWDEPASLTDAGAA